VTRRSRRLTVMTLDADTLAALDVAAETAQAAGLPVDNPHAHTHSRSSMVRYIVREWEKQGGLQRLQEIAREMEEAR